LHHAHIGRFAWLVLLEGSRLQEQGDLPGAWGWYRSLILMHTHIRRSASVIERLFASFNCKDVRTMVDSWAPDPRTQVADLRRALDDVLACAPRPEWDANSLKIDYLIRMRELSVPNSPITQGDDAARNYRIGGEALPPSLAQSLYDARRFLIHEPERTRRV